MIPALNEERSLPRVLGDLPQVGHVIVVDNGSIDNTAAAAAAAGAHVVVEPRRGYGSACLAGLAEVESLTQHTPSPEIIVFLDADYSDHPELLPSLVSPIEDGQADLVVGSRLTGQREPGAMPPQSIWGNRFACWLMRVLWGARYTDLGPFRAIRLDLLRTLDMQDRNFGWTVEMQVKAARQQLRCQEISVPYRRRVGASKISGTLLGTLRAGYKILFTIAKQALTPGP